MKNVYYIIALILLNNSVYAGKLNNLKEGAIFKGTKLTSKHIECIEDLEKKYRPLIKKIKKTKKEIKTLPRKINNEMQGFLSNCLSSGFEKPKPGERNTIAYDCAGIATYVATLMFDQFKKDSCVEIVRRAYNDCGREARK